MNAIRNKSVITWLGVPAILCLFLFASEGTTFAQGGGGVDLGGFDGGGAVQDQTGGAVTGDTGTDGGGNAGGGGEDGEIDAVEPTRLSRTIEDVRNQGFVGPTAAYTESNGFIGPPRGEPTATNLPDDGRFAGGGVNQGLGQRNIAASTVLLERGFVPEENGFMVQRGSIRARLVPAFSAPTRPPAFTVSRFQSRMTRQPSARSIGQGVSISVSNRTAVLTGQVRSQSERDVIKRQLRLEPGVYRIEDRTAIAN